MGVTPNPVFDWDSEGWRDQAACRCCDAELFFPAGNTGVAVDHIRAAKSVCQRCPVQRACLEFALATKQEAGIWGGTDEEERHRMRSAWRADRRLPKTSAMR
ncbi:MAG TPA: WhiB family transcriptional regulator [Acidimicrobiales bacterium]|nr:WhiB family transcriptional regulator [Acidimicrobiales bacterium]